MEYVPIGTYSSIEEYEAVVCAPVHKGTKRDKGVHAFWFRNQQQQARAKDSLVSSAGVPTQCAANSCKIGCRAREIWSMRCVLMCSGLCFIRALHLLLACAADRELP